MKTQKEKIRVNANLIRRKNIFYTDIRWREGGKQVIKRNSTRLTISNDNKKEDKDNELKAHVLLEKEKNKWEKFLKEEQKTKTTSDFTKKPHYVFEDMVNHFLKTKKMKLRETTFEKYEIIFRSRIIPAFKEVNMKNFKIEHVEDFLLDLKNTGKSSSTIRHYYTYLKDVLTFGYNRGYLKKDVARLIAVPEKIVQKKMNIFTREELNCCINSVNDDTWKLILFLGGFYGLRRSEIIGLRWKDIDFERKTLSIRNTGILAIINGKEQLVFQEKTKTKSSERKLPISNELFKLLKLQKSIQEKREELFGSSELVITNELNKSFRPDFITRNFKKIIKNYNENNTIKLPILRFHDLRHTCAFLLYEANTDIKTIQYWLGHSSIRITLDIYTEFSKKKLDAAKKVIDSLTMSFV